jgi:diacylglycerol kinase (ATP)
MGGDGTFQALANAAVSAACTDLVLGVLPCGGGNDFAAALAIPRDAVAAAQAIFSMKPRAVDLLRARTADGRERVYVGGGGVGLDAEAAQLARTVYRRWPGRLRYVAAALRALRDFEPLTVRAQFPANKSPGSELPAELPTIEKQVLLASVLNTPTFGAGIRLAPDSRLDDGLLTVGFVDAMSALGVLRLLPLLMLSGELPESRVTRVQAGRVRLSADRPCLFHGDGEIFGPAPVEIEVLPRAIRVLAPPSRTDASKRD